MDAWSVYKKENPWKHFKKYWHPIILNLDIFVTNEINSYPTILLLNVSFPYLMAFLLGETLMLQLLNLL